MAAAIEHRAFSLAPDEWAHVDFTRRLRQRLEAMGGGKVCELGGGARPALELEFLQRNKLECLVVDIAAPELAKAPEGYAWSRFGEPEYTDWLDESLSWKHTCYIGDWSFLWQPARAGRGSAAAGRAGLADGRDRR